MATAELLRALSRALEAEPGVRVAVLFGSEARGQATAGSDVDVAVVAPGVDRLALVSRLSLAVGRDVDVVSLDDPGVPLLSAIVRDGIPVREATRGAYAGWRARALAQLETDGPWYRRMRDAWLARVATTGLSDGRP
jgi:predicted nucleotidyltransferase